MATLLLVAFIACLYAPYLIFKFFAEASVDIGRRKDETKAEEFFAAALPSLYLNAITFGFLYLAGLAGRWFTDWRLFRSIGVVDWNVVASIFDPSFAVLRRHVSFGLQLEIGYLVVLYSFAAFAGVVYGSVELTLATRGVDANYLLRSGTTSRRVAWLAALLFRRVWLPFFAEVITQQWTWMTRETWMFVRTKDDRLFYGRFYEYTKSSGGDIDTIVLISAQRYSRTGVPAALAQGRSPLTRLHGSIVIAWSQVADVNVVAPEMMLAVRRKYADALRSYQHDRRRKQKPRSIADLALRLFGARRRRK